MSELEASTAYEKFDIPESAHSTVLREASATRPWTPEIADSPGVEIDEGVYAEGVLQADPREKQDRHDILIDGRLERYRQNIEEGKNRWDLVLVEQDFYQHPDEFNVDSSVQHNRHPGDELRKGDADLLFLDLDEYDIHMIEAKPHDGYVDTQTPQASGSEASKVDPLSIQDFENLEDSGEYAEARDFQQNAPEKGSVAKKARNLSEAWQTVVGELENDWTVYHPEYVFGSDVLDASELTNNPEYALPHSYDQSTGYAFGTDTGFEKAEASEDLETLNETFFRGEITELLEGKRPEMERKSVV